MLSSMNNPLKVALLSISPHNRAILEFFFAGAGKKIFAAVATEQAEAFIVDFDHPGARQEWLEQSAAALKPAIVLSVKETVEENIIWVSKPLTSQALSSAAEQIRILLPKTETTSGADRSTTESKQNIAALRALLDKQAEDAHPFGVSKQNIRKAPPAAPDSQSGSRQDALVFTSVETVIADKTATASDEEVMPDSSQPAEVEDEHHLRTEDVYIPPLLEDDDIGDVGSSFQLDTVADSDDPIRLEQRWNRLCGYEQEISASNWHESSSL